jgi:hypothetical protein
MAGLGSPARIWRWPLHYYMVVRSEFLKATGIAARGPKRHDVEAGEKVVRRETRNGIEFVHYEKE